MSLQKTGVWFSARPQPESERGDEGRGRFALKPLLGGPRRLDNSIPSDGFTNVSLAFLRLAPATNDHFRLTVKGFEEPAPIFRRGIARRDAGLGEGLGEPVCPFEAVGA